MVGASPEAVTAVLTSVTERDGSPSLSFCAVPKGSNDMCKAMDCDDTQSGMQGTDSAGPHPRRKATLRHKLPGAARPPAEHFAGQWARLEQSHCLPLPPPPVDARRIGPHNL